MRTTSLVRVFGLSLSFLLVPALCHADETKEAKEVKEEAKEPDVVKPSSSPAGRGVAFGFDNGLFGRAFEQSARIRLPIAEYFAVNLRGISTFGPMADDTRWELGGRVELVGHTPVYLNLVRLYGGGGPEVAARATGPGDKKTAFGGGGHFGFEFFLKPSMSFYAEIGGHGGNELTAGGTAVAGMMFYPFTGP
jgi:hypothetical protein